MHVTAAKADGLQTEYHHQTSLHHHGCMPMKVYREGREEKPFSSNHAA